MSEYIYDGKIDNSLEKRYNMNDIISHYWGRPEVVQYYPLSIASKYVIGTPQIIDNTYAHNNTAYRECIDYNLLIKLTNEVSDKYDLNKYKNKQCVLHLRLGDAFDFWNVGYNLENEEYIVNFLINNVPHDYTINIISVNAKYIPNNGNLENAKKYEKKSNDYLKNVIKLLKNTYSEINNLNNSHPDIDLCRMVNADIFIPGKGGYSSLACEIRNRKGLINTYDDKIA